MLGQRVLYDHIWLANVNLKPLGLRNVFVGDCDARYETFGFWEMSKQKKKGKTDDQYFFTSKYNKVRNSKNSALLWRQACPAFSLWDCGIAFCTRGLSCALGIAGRRRE
jgi:hypothetical protein